VIRIVVADDHPIVRSGIVALLQTAPDVEVVGEASSGREAVALALLLKPDLVMMDLRMPLPNTAQTSAAPALDGAAATAAILAAEQAAEQADQDR